MMTGADSGTLRVDFGTLALNADFGTILALQEPIPRSLHRTL